MVITHLMPGRSMGLLPAIEETGCVTVAVGTYSDARGA